MTDDPIRALLAPIVRRAFDTPAGYVVVSRGEVEAAGGEHEAVLAWVRAHGGDVHRPADMESQLIGLGRWRRHVQRGQDLYLIPADALTED